MLERACARPGCRIPAAPSSTVAWSLPRSPDSLALGLLLGSAKGLAGGEASRYIALAALTIVSSWLLVHTVLALHYTHVCYHIAEESREKPPNVGVVFPNEPQPDFLDFAYFSFVIGMTCQVSDVQITSRRIRRIALLHGLLSFGFNTVILVLSLNLASALLSREGR